MKHAWSLALRKVNQVRCSFGFWESHKSISLNRLLWVLCSNHCDRSESLNAMANKDSSSIVAQDSAVVIRWDFIQAFRSLPANRVLAS